VIQKIHAKKRMSVIKHKFFPDINDKAGPNVGAQCVRCGQITLYENGKIPDDISEQCKSSRRDRR